MKALERGSEAVSIAADRRPTSCGTGLDSSVAEAARPMEVEDDGDVWPDTELSCITGEERGAASVCTDGAATSP